MSEHQEKKKRKAQKALIKPQPLQKSEEKPKRSLKTALKEIWGQKENRFLVICAIGLLIIFLSTDLPGRLGLYVQSAIVVLIVMNYILRSVLLNGKTQKESTEEKEVTKSEENT